MLTGKAVGIGSFGLPVAAIATVARPSSEKSVASMLMFDGYEIRGKSTRHEH